MSLFLTQARARSSRAPTAPRPRLTVVPTRASRARRVPFVALVVSLLATGLVGLLVLNTSLQRGAYVVTDLRAEAADLTLRQQNLQTKVADLQAPQRVAEQAQAIGMVRNDNPAFLSLATGKVMGVPKAAQPGNRLYLGRPASTLGPTRKASPVWAGTRNSSTTGIQRAPAANSGQGRRTPAHPKAKHAPKGVR